MTIIKGNGGYIISAIVKKGNFGIAYLDTKQYIYYEKKEAIQQFKQYLKNNNLIEVIQ